MAHPVAETIVTPSPGPLHLPYPRVVAWCVIGSGQWSRRSSRVDWTAISLIFDGATGIASPAERSHGSHGSQFGEPMSSDSLRRATTQLG